MQSKSKALNSSLVTNKALYLLPIIVLLAFNNWQSCKKIYFHSSSIFSIGTKASEAKPSDREFNKATWVEVKPRVT